MFHNNIEMCKSYYEEPEEYKRKRILKWKGRGVIYDDFDDLYDIYINTMNCQNCKKPFETSKDRCLDHDHETGLFRKILCQGCNTYDSHLKYPANFTSKEKEQAYFKKYREEHKEQSQAYFKKYSEEHKEIKQAYNKAYNEKHKEERCAKNRQKLQCFFCGKHMSTSSLTRHYNKGYCPNIKPIN